MAFRAETLPWFGKQKVSNTVVEEASLGWMIAKPIGIMDRIRTAAVTGDPRDITKAKQEAWQQGRVKGVFAEIVLFNAER